MKIYNTIQYCALFTFVFFATNIFSQNPTNLSCGVSSGQSLTSNGFTGDAPISSAGSCGQCCFSGSDLDGDGDQDVSFSVENGQWFRFCNPSNTVSMTVDAIVDETNNNCNIQGACFVTDGSGFNGATDAVDIDCSNSEYQEYGSNPGGAADGFSFNGVVLPPNGCIWVFVDGYAGATCGAFTVEIVCPCSPPATPTASNTGPYCEGATISLSTPNVSGATYAWSGPGGFSSTQQNPTITNATTAMAGTYSVVITVAGCSSTAGTTTVVVNPAATANASSDQTICSGSTVTLAGSIGGGASSGTWSAAGGGTFSPNTTTLNATFTPSASQISAGTAVLTLTTNDPSGPCPAVTDQMTITINPLPTVNAGSDQSACEGTVFNITGTIGGGASSSTWSTSGTGIFGSTTSLNTTYTPSAADVTSGTVTLTLTTNDPAGPCIPVSDNLVLTITPLQNASFSYANGTYCQTGTDPTPNITGTGSGTFSSTPAGLSINSSTGTIDLSASSLNSYSVTYTTPGPCPNSMSVSLTVTTAPTAGFSYTGTPYCQNGSDPLPTFDPGAGGGTFSSTSGLVFISTSTGQVDLSASTPGTYTVQNDIAASGGCSAANASTSITIDGSASASADIDQTICEGSTINLNGSISGTASTLTWSGGTGTFTPDANTANAVYSPSSTEITAGTVTLTITTDDPTGACPAATDQMTITINQQATVSADVDQEICAGSTVTLNGSFAGSAASATWSGGTGSFVPGAGTLNADYSPSAGDISNGSVTLILSSDDPIGPCNAVSDTMMITINDPAVVSADIDQSICEGEDVTLNGSMSGSATMVTWSGGTGTFTPDANTLNAVYTPSAAEITAGTVTLTITTDDPTGPCLAASDQMNITINPAANANAGNDTTISCTTTSLVLNGSSTTSGAQYSWAGPGLVSGGNSATPTIDATGTYYLTVTDPNGGCSAYDTVVVSFDNSGFNPSISADTSVCAGSSVTLSVTGGSSYYWVIGDTTSSISVTPSSTTSYYVVVMEGICADSLFVTINVNPLPSIDATGTPTIILNGGSSNLNVTGGVSYVWSPTSSLSCSTCSNPVASPTTTTTYTVIGTDANGCINQDTITIRVDESCPEIFLPNAFSPGNSTGLNDLWCVEGNDCIISMELKLFDRWGELVYESTDPTGCWDGRDKTGTLYNNGVFYYVFDATLIDGTIKTINGNVSIIK